jgi:RND family efflux transporter MFP subunit
MNQFRWILLGGLLLAAPAFAADEVKISATQSRTMGLEVAPPKSVPASAGNPLPGQVVVPNNQLHIVAAPVAGLVETLAAAAGQSVKKGQLLARLQSPALAEIQRGFLQAATQSRLAADSLARDEKLWREGIIAESRYLSAQGHYAESAAQLAERHQALKLAGIGDAALERLKKNAALSGTVEILAPADGVVLEQMALAGQRVEAAAPLYKLAKLKPLWLEIQAPLKLATELKGGEKVAISAYPAAGKLIVVGRSVAEGSQTVMLRAEINEGAENLRPGQFVEVSVVSPAAGAQWRIPASALVREGARTLVFVQSANGFRIQQVAVLAENANGLVVGGLKGDERIAVRGVVALKGAWQGISEGAE